ncbi:MAG: PrsW family intramembrane metalloprotease [Ruminococcus sp.]|nr:PrsW family intramembrane metalloprotease [Ruminococcus sp.]
MSVSSIVLATVALLPAIALCIFVFKKDRAEKEPVGLLLLLFALGAVICFPVAGVETLMYSINDVVFSPFITESGGTKYLDSVPFFFYQVSTNFLCIALVEEGFKFLVLYLITHKNKNFNSLFDGVVYAVFVSLGFAALENIMYSFDYGISTALIRAVTAVPGHMFFGVLMGYFYTFWHLNKKCRDTESKLMANGWITSLKFRDHGKRELVLAMVVPVLVHGFYDFCLSFDSTLLSIIFVVFLVGLYVFCFARIAKLSNLDCRDEELVVSMLCRSHPGLYEALSAHRASAQSNTYN